MFDEEITEELINELSDLAGWEGCETGDLCNNLLDLWEGSGSSYASDNFQKALKAEILELYTTLKEEKDYEDAEKELKSKLFPEEGTRVKILIGDLEFSLSTNSKIDNRNHKELAKLLREICDMLEAETVEDREIF